MPHSEAGQASQSNRTEKQSNRESDSSVSRRGNLISRSTLVILLILHLIKFAISSVLHGFRQQVLGHRVLPGLDVGRKPAAKAGLDGVSGPASPIGPTNDAIDKSSAVLGGCPADADRYALDSSVIVAR